MLTVTEEVRADYEKYTQDEARRLATYQAFKLLNPKPQIKLGDVVNICGFTETKLIKTNVVKIPENQEYEMWIDCEGEGVTWGMNTVSLDYNEDTKEWNQITPEEAIKRGLKVFER